MNRLSPENQCEINALKTNPNLTKRVISEGLESILYDPIPVLDHGFIRVVDYMGNDSAIVQAARVSYGTGTKKIQEDRGLIRYLLRHYHTTPFEMAEIKLHVKLPIFVARQWIRHRTANVNEYSARYSVLDREFYVPTLEHLAVQSLNNRQGRSECVDAGYGAEVLEMLKKDAASCYDHYTYLLNEDQEAGRPSLARELARMNLPINWYTQWYWKIDLHNLLHFIHLRADSHAQYEIRVYADVLLTILNHWVPITYEAFQDYRLHAHSFSKHAFEVLKKRLQGIKVSYAESGLSKREWDELEVELSC